MMQASQRQKGAVNIVFFVVALVIAIFGWVLWFTAFRDLEEAQKSEKVALNSLKTYEAQVGLYTTQVNRVMSKVGLENLELPIDAGDPAIEDKYIEEQIDPRISRLDKLVSEARSLFKGDESMTKVTNVLDPAQASLEQLEARVSQLSRDLVAAKADKQAAELANDNLIRDNRTALSKKDEELSTERGRADERVKQVEDQVDATQRELTARSDELERVRKDSRKQVSDATNAMVNLDREVKSHKMASRHARDHNKPDGDIIEVDARTRTCYIDLGSRDQLRRGTRFRTFGFKKGMVREVHGFITVIDIEFGRALCSIDPTASPKAGDKIENPFYDREKIQVFHFLGSLPGRFDNQQAETILKKFGATVHDDFSLHVDFLVLGDNPEPNTEEGAEPDVNWFKATTTYTDADRWGIEMLRARDLEEFLQF